MITIAISIIIGLLIYAVMKSANALKDVVTPAIVVFAIFACLLIQGVIAEMDGRSADVSSSTSVRQDLQQFDNGDGAVYYTITSGDYSRGQQYMTVYTKVDDTYTQQSYYASIQPDLKNSEEPYIERCLQCKELNTYPLGQILGKSSSSYAYILHVPVDEVLKVGE